MHPFNAMRLFPFVLLISCASFSRAQTVADNWYFGANTGITFSNGAAEPLAGSMMQTAEGCASYSDPDGNLLFYSDGVTVWARDHSVMPNGTGLNSSSTCTQAALVVPHPGNDSLFYIFTPPDMFNPSGSFCYSIVDLTLNGGYGDVTEKNIPLFSPSTEKVTGVVARNKHDYWVIGHGYGNADFYSFSVTSQGIDPVPVISTAGMPHAYSDDNNIGQMKASPCGDRIAVVVLDSAFVEVFDFNDQTGEVSNPIHLGDFTPNNAWGPYGLEFSPNGSRLYMTQVTPGIVVQYDLWAGTPADVILSADTVAFSGPFDRFSSLQNAPDGKIYIAKTEEDHLAAIEHPDSLGAACGYVANAVSLPPIMCAHGLPNFITSIFCQETLPTYTHDRRDEVSGTTLFPNPATESTTVYFPGEGAALITLYDACGRMLIQQPTLANGATGVPLDLQGLASGIYAVEVLAGSTRSVARLIKD
jgi:hypothetical protein